MASLPEFYQLKKQAISFQKNSARIFFFYIYISIKKNYNTNYNTYNINITILLERYPGEQATMTRICGEQKFQNTLQQMTAKLCCKRFCLLRESAVIWRTLQQSLCYIEFAVYLQFQNAETAIHLGFKHYIFIVVVAYYILSRLLCLPLSASLGLLCIPHPGVGPLV